MPQKSKNALDGDIITIHRGLAIYKVKASPFWHARIRDHRSKKYVVRSTKETSRVKARQAARELEFEILGGEKRVEREYTFRFYEPSRVYRRHFFSKPTRLGRAISGLHGIRPPLLEAAGVR
jgi:hypothetical protein